MNDFHKNERENKQDPAKISRGRNERLRNYGRTMMPSGNRTSYDPFRMNTKGKGRLGRIVAVWVSVLAVLFVFIMVISLSGRRGGGNSDDLMHVNAAVGDGRTVTNAVTDTDETYPVSYASYSDDTKSFSGDLTFSNGILIDLNSNTVMASRGGDDRIYPASMTKIMTLIVAYENAESLDDTFTMTAEITDPLYLANASVAGFSVGEEVTVRDLIYGLILPSGGDGAMGLAYHIAGGEAAFAELMNKKAKELGLKNTHFTNCTGLHDAKHYSTCHEVALMLEYAIQDDFMREVLSTYKYTTAKTPEHPEGIELTSTLLSRMYGDESGTAFVIGGKTGYTLEAKNCLATFATSFTEGESEEEIYNRSPDYILVTAGSTDKWGPVFDAIEVYKDFAGDGTDYRDGDASDTSESGDKASSGSGGVVVYTAAN